MGGDAGNLRVHPGGALVVGSDGLVVVDASARRAVATVRLPAHAEGFQIDGDRLYVNLPGAGGVGVADLASQTLQGAWPNGGRRFNYPLTIDRRAREVAVVYRLPARLVTFDPDSGAQRQALETCGDSDDLFFDEKRSRLDVICGDGGVDVFERRGRELQRMARVKTASGARTALFVPELDRLLVAAPPRGGRSAATRASARTAMKPAGRWFAPWAAGVSSLIAATGATAGPPYVTDDPVPTDRGRWEVYAFAAATRGNGLTEEDVGLDINFGAAEDLQLTLVAPLAFEREGGSRLQLADIEVAAKYRFLRQSGPMPEVAFFPKVTLPTGRAPFTEGRPTLSLPVWAQKDLGPWSVFGGGGPQLRRGRDVWLSGLVTRTLGEGLTVGGEVFHETAEERDEEATAGVNVGLTYRLNERRSFLASGGPVRQPHEDAKFNA